MYCPFCGGKNLEGDRYCAFCGKRLSEVDSAQHQDDRQSEDRNGIMLFFIEAAVMFISLGLLIYINMTAYSPEHIVEKYVKAKVGQDWSTLYDMIDIDDTSEFMDKQAYVTAQFINQDKKETSYVRVLDIQKQKSETGTRTYLVEYQQDGEKDSMEVTAVKKNMKWRIREDLDIVRDFKISVPKGADLAVDKISVSSAMKTHKNNSSRDVYTIARVFGPTHYVEVTGDGIESAVQLVTAPEDGEAVSIQADYDQGQLEELSQKAFNDLDTILTGAAQDKNYSSIPILKNMRSKKKDKVLDAYNHIKNDIFENDSKNRHLVRYTLKDCEAVVNAEGSKNRVQVKIKGKYKMEFIDEWKDDELETETGTCTHKLTYLNDGGGWSLYSASFDFPEE